MAGCCGWDWPWQSLEEAAVPAMSLGAAAKEIEGVMQLAG